MRPDVVWFGEPLPQGAWEEALRYASQADVMLVVGTSAAVYPAAHLQHLAKGRGALLININTAETPLDEIADYNIRGRAADVLPKLVEHAKWLRRI